MISLPLYEDICAGKIAAISRAITAVENRVAGYLSLLDRLYRLPRHSYVIGITGAPGSGKSTFTNQLVKTAFGCGKKLAVVAIDPSSRFSGGALLGDRVRFSDDYPLDRVFFRSMASECGSVNSSLFHVIQILNAAAFDWVIVESVGSGQNDMEIEDYVDVLLLILVADMGDEIQCMKAGIMEIADLFAINKIDLVPPGPLIVCLSNILSDAAQGRVFPTDSLHGQGFAEVFARLEERRVPSGRDPERDARLILDCELDRLFREGPLHLKLQKLLARESSPYRALSKLEELWERLLGELDGQGP